MALTFVGVFSDDRIRLPKSFFVQRYALSRFYKQGFVMFMGVFGLINLFAIATVASAFFARITYKGGFEKQGADFVLDRRAVGLAEFDRQRLDFHALFDFA